MESAHFLLVKPQRRTIFQSDEVKKETDEEWTQIVVKGKNKMPAYDKKLTDAETKEVVAYVRTLSSK